MQKGPKAVTRAGSSVPNEKVTVQSQIVEVREQKGRLWLANCSDFPVRDRNSRLHLLSRKLDPNPGYVHEVVK